MSPHGEKPPVPRVAVVVLNHNGKVLAEKCLRSVLDSAYPDKDVIVVDNASSDGSVAYLRALFPGVTILENPENLGVAGGRNCGFREAVSRGQRLYSFPRQRCLYRSASDRRIGRASAESDPRIGVLGPKTYCGRRFGQIQCAGGRISYTQNVCSERGAGKSDRGQYDKIEDMDYFPGCGFMARREVFEKLNFLDETFYGYGHEDTDFCMRAARLGYRVVYVPQALMWHRGSTTIGGYSPRKKYLEAINSVYFVRKYGTPKESYEVCVLCRFWTDLCARCSILSRQPQSCFRQGSRHLGRPAQTYVVKAANSQWSISYATSRLHASSPSMRSLPCC